MSETAERAGNYSSFELLRGAGLLGGNVNYRHALTCLLNSREKCDRKFDEYERRVYRQHMNWQFLLIGILLATTWNSTAGSKAFAQTGSVPRAASPTAAVTFDVATIKPHSGMISMAGLTSRADGVDGAAATLSMLVEYAYGLRSDDQVSLGPDWTKTDRFDIQARMGEADTAAMGKLSSAEKRAALRRMVQALLSDRFQLKVHSATRQVPVYDLIVAKGGAKLKDAAFDANGQILLGKDGKPLHGILSWATGKVVAQGYSVQNLADFLSQPMCALGRPVMNKTNLIGTYDFTLDWSPQFQGVRFGAESGSVSPEDMPSIFSALADLGLKLQPSSGPVETIVIDHVARPTKN